MSALFELLFKYQPLLFERGTLVFRPLWPWWMTWVLAAIAVAAAYVLYRRWSHALPATWRYGLTGLRAAAFLIVILLLLRPALRLHSAIPQMNFVAVAVDTSRSMDLRDGSNNRTRREIAQGILQPDAARLLTQLGNRFKLRYFAFSKTAERVSGFEPGLRPGNATNLGKSLSQIAAEFAAAPLAGIVLLTDGADNQSENLENTAAQLRARNIPVYSIGVGSSQIVRDVEVLRASAPRQVLKDTTLEAEVTIQSTGYAGRRTELLAYDRDRLLDRQEITLGRDGEAKIFKLQFPCRTSGAKVFTFSVAPFPDETISENNGQTALVHVEDAQPEILYIEGEPRWEYGFLRRAILQDKNIQLAALLRQADGKFLGQGPRSSANLEKGFPSDKGSLFKYKALIIGSVEASFFTFDQLRMVSDFVSQRGGGFLMLGGRNSFAQGGYRNTPVAEVLPVALGQDAAGASAFQDVEYTLQLTPYGLQHPITRFAVSEEQTRKRWAAAPAMVGFNPTASLKPGATALLYGNIPDARGRNPVILAFQRFGKGRSVAFTTASSWRWRMGQEHTDNFHELFWKQLLRWLVSDVPDPVQIMPEKPSYAPDDTVVVRAEVNDASFMPLNTARLVTEVKAPSGRIDSLQLNWDVDKDGAYSASFQPSEEGIHEIASEAFQGDRSLGAAKSYVRIAESTEEFHGAAMNPKLLKNLSSITGGRFYAADDWRSLPEDIAYIDKGASRIEDKDLWDMPFFFLLLIGVVSAEWILRKRKGLV